MSFHRLSRKFCWAPRYITLLLLFILIRSMTIFLSFLQSGQEVMDAARQLLKDPVVKVLGSVGLSILGGGVFLYGKIDSSESKLEEKITTEITKLDARITTEITKLDARITTEMGQLRSDLKTDRQVASDDRHATHNILVELLKSQRRSWW